MFMKHHQPDDSQQATGSGKGQRMDERQRQIIDRCPASDRNPGGGYLTPQA